MPNFNLPSFEYDDDELDENTENMDDDGIERPPFKFLIMTTHPTLDDVKKEIARIKKNFETMSTEDIFRNIPSELRTRLISDYEYKDSLPTSEKMAIMRAVNSRAKDIILNVSPENRLLDIQRDIRNQMRDHPELFEDEDNDLPELSDEVREEINNSKKAFKSVLQPVSQAELDKLPFAEAFMKDLEELNAESDDGGFYGYGRLGKKVMYIPGRETLDFFYFDFEDKTNNLWFKLYYKGQELNEAQLRQFLSDHCHGLNWIERWKANVEEESNVWELQKKYETFIDRYGTDPISELSEYVNVHYFINEEEIDDLLDSLESGMKKFVEGLSQEEIDELNAKVFKKDLVDGKISKPLVKPGMVYDTNHYNVFPSDSEGWLKSSDAFSQVEYVPTTHLYEKVVEKFGNEPTVEDLMKCGVKTTGVRVYFEQYDTIQLYRKESVPKKYVLGYMQPKAKTMTGVYVAFYMGPDGELKLCIPAYGNSVDPNNGYPYSIKEDADYFDDDGALIGFDLRRVLSQLEFVMYPTTKVKTSISDLGQLFITIDSKPDIKNGRFLLGRLRFNNSTTAIKFKEENSISDDYVKVYLKPVKTVRKEETLWDINEFFYTMGNKFTESKLVSRSGLKKIDDKWYIDITLSDTIEHLDDMYSE